MSNCHEDPTNWTASGWELGWEPDWEVGWEMGWEVASKRIDGLRPELVNRDYEQWL